VICRLTSRSSGRVQRRRPAAPGSRSGAPLNSRSVRRPCPVEERAQLGTNDFHAWLFVAKLEGVPVAPHAVHLLLTVDEPEAKKAQEDLGVPLRFLSWRSFQGEATDEAFCVEIAQAIRAGVADAGPGVRAIRVK
jgi:hypothetical protein